MLGEGRHRSTKITKRSLNENLIRNDGTLVVNLDVDVPVLPPAITISNGKSLRKNIPPSCYRSQAGYPLKQRYTCQYDLSRK